MNHIQNKVSTQLTGDNYAVTTPTEENKTSLYNYQPLMEFLTNELPPYAVVRW